MSASQVEESSGNQSSRANYLKIRNDDEFYSQKRRDHLDKLINSETGDLVEKDKKLKI